MRSTMASRLPLQPNSARNFGFLTSPYLSHSVASSQFRLKVTCHPFSWMPTSRARLLKATRFNNLRHIILSASATELKEDLLLSGTQLKDKPSRQLNADTILVVSEGICISIASVSCLASLSMHGSQDSRLVMSSALEPIMPQKADLPMWQNFFLLAALIINSILRARQWQSKGHSRDATSKLGVAESNVEGRVQKLEEDIASAVTIIRVLSKQLEKLAVRFRVTRQTLRDPIQETAGLAKKTSEIVNVLAAREDALEKDLEEMHYVLLRMQENQTKQLELISTLGKFVKDGLRNKVEKSNKAGRNNPIPAGQGRSAKGSDGNVSEKLGGFTAKKSGGTERTGMKTLERESSSAQAEAKMESKEPSNIQSSSSKVNNMTPDTHRVDFWLNTPVSSSTHVEEPIGDANITNHSLNDDRPRAAFLE